jgi:hypothetical protein
VIRLWNSGSDTEVYCFIIFSVKIKERHFLGNYIGYFASGRDMHNSCKGEEQCKLGEVTLTFGITVFNATFFLFNFAVGLWVLRLLLAYCTSPG